MDITIHDTYATKIHMHSWLFTVLHAFPDLSYATLFSTRCLTPFELRELHESFWQLRTLVNLSELFKNLEGAQVL